MSNVSHFVTTDNTTLDIVAKTGRGLIRATMESTSTSTAFVASADGVTELYDGLTIVLKNTVVASASGCTLKLNTLDAKGIWLSQSNSACTTHFELNTTYIFIYDATNARWELQQGRDTNSNTVGRTIYTAYTNVTSGTNGLKKYSLFARTANGKYTSFTTNSGTGTKTFDTTTQFDFSNIFYYPSADDLAANSLTADSTLYSQIESINLRYSFTGVTTSSSTSVLTAKLPVYLCVTSDGKLVSPYYTQSPTSSTTTYYILLGYMRDSYRMDLLIYNPMYSYDGTSFKLVQYADNKVSKSGDTMTGDLTVNAEVKPKNDLHFQDCGSTTQETDWPNNAVEPGITWKEDGYGDKFEIRPHFKGFDDDNFLGINASTGAAGTNPNVTNIAKLSPSGDLTLYPDVDEGGTGHKNYIVRLGESTFGSFKEGALQISSPSAENNIGFFGASSGSFGAVLDFGVYDASRGHFNSVSMETNNGTPLVTVSSREAWIKALGLGGSSFTFNNWHNIFIYRKDTSYLYIYVPGFYAKGKTDNTEYTASGTITCSSIILGSGTTGGNLTASKVVARSWGSEFYFTFTSSFGSTAGAAVFNGTVTI